jgi:glucose-6-phosphate 1-epimerase
MLTADKTLNNLHVTEIKSGESIFRLSNFGGQLIAWEKSGVPILFENKEGAIKDGVAAYRGGAPIIFPYFGKGLLLPDKKAIEPQHGAARRSIWERQQELENDRISLSTEQPSAGGYPTTVFKLEVTYAFSGDGIDISSKITNIGGRACPFQFAVHSYWQTANLNETSFSGLGNRYFDNLKDLALVEEASQAAQRGRIFTSPVDRIYLDSLPEQKLSTPEYLLSIKSSGMNSTVIWNPGENHGLKDLKAVNFLCVEAGIIYPAPALAPGEASLQTIRYKVELK